jgi:hypothetical protein
MKPKLLGMLALAAMSAPLLANSTELVSNGGFETGNFSGWTRITTGSPFIDWTVSAAGAGSGFSMAPTSPQEGVYDAWNGFDGAGPMSFALYQDVAIPGNTTALLSWNHRAQWNFDLTRTATQPRLFEVQLRDPSSDAVLATLHSFSTGTSLVIGDTGWVSATADLSAFAGSSVRIYFFESIPESFTGPAQLEIDAVSLRTQVPEPATLALLGLGFAGLGFVRRRKAH